MTRALRSPQRYQLSKHALAIVESDHPWIFRDQLSSAAAALADGQWVALYDGSNKVVGHGVYQTTGAVGIRILSRGPDRPNAVTLGLVIDAALAKREPLWAETDAVRALHGESDGIPGVVVDVFRGAQGAEAPMSDDGRPRAQPGGVAVVQAYAPGLFGLARWAARRVADRLGLTTIIEKPPKRGRGGGEASRALRGTLPGIVKFTEGTRVMVASPSTGQKSGTFLDLRGLRRELANRKLEGARVLDLFCYTGGLGLAASVAGAKEVWHVDASEAALELGDAHHAGGAATHTWIEADVFEWLPELDPAAQFEVVIVDPPSMTSSMDQVPRVLAAYKKLYAQARRHVAPGGLLIACCCTSRVARHQFRKTVGDALGGGKGFDLDHELPAEVDHPVGFPQADYLKIFVFKSRR